MIDPRLILQMMLKNPDISNNTMLQNAIGMMQGNNIQGLQSLAQNICKTKGIDLEQAKRQVEQMYMK